MTIYFELIHIILNCGHEVVTIDYWIGFITKKINLLFIYLILFTLLVATPPVTDPHTSIII